MSYQVLARKWRPRNFSELMGQAHVVRALTNALDQNRLHHAWLFTGTRGVGKTTIARILAKSLNCETGITASPCGVCSACQQIDTGRYVDLIELDAASNTGVDSMREVLDNAHYAPTVGRFKVYIIDEVHMLSRSAFNSMLKTLEEPPEHVKFILATTDPQKIPVTVLSRCLQFNLKQMTPMQISTHLQHILQQESINAESAAINRIAHAARGSMRDALSLLDQAIAHCGGDIRDDRVQEMLGGLDRAGLCGLLDAIADANGPTLLERSANLSERSIDHSAALQELALILHQISLYQTIPSAIAEDTPDLNLISQLADRLNPDTVQLYYQICLLGKRDLPLAPDETSGFNMTLLRMLTFYPDQPTGNQPVLAKHHSAQDQPTRAVTATSSNSTASTKSNPHILNDNPAPLIIQSDPPITSRTSIEIDTPETMTQPTSPDIAAPLPTNAIQWAELVKRLRLGGQARMLAAECELVEITGHTIHLRLAQEHRHLTDPGYQTRLCEALEKHFGLPIRLQLHLAEGETNSPQRQQTEARERLQADAEQAVQNNPLIQDIIQQMDGRVISITPIANS